MDYQSCWLSHTQARPRSRRDNSLLSVQLNTERTSVKAAARLGHVRERTSDSVGEFCRQSEDIRRELQGLRPAVTSRRTLAEIPSNMHNSDIKEKLGKYELEARAREEEIMHLRQELQQTKDQKSHHSTETQAQMLLSQVCSILNIKDTHQVLPTVRSLMRGQSQAQEASEVLRTIGSLVCPEHLEASVPELLAALKRWKEERQSSPNTQSADLVQHIRQVFTLKNTDNVQESMSRIYLQMQEMKAFARQIRQALGLDADTPLRTVAAVVKATGKR